MYSGSYKHRPGTVTAFEDAYAKEDFLRRSASAKNLNGCTPYTENVCAQGKDRSAKEACGTENEKGGREMVPCNEETPSVPCKSRKGDSGLLSGMDGGDILLVLLILFFLSDKDPENDGLIPVLLALVLLF